MSKHLAAAPKKKKKRSAKNAKELPRLFVWKAPERRVFRYLRVLSKEEVMPVLAATVLFLAARIAPLSALFKLIAYAVSAFVAGFSILRRAVEAVLQRRAPDEDCFALLSALCAFLASYPAFGALIVILARVQELMESYILTRSARGIESIRERLPEKAHAEEEFGIVDVLPEELHEGDIFIVRQGETVPVDGVVVDGFSRVDSSAFGGKDMPSSVSSGDMVLAGGVNMGSKMDCFQAVDHALTRHLRSLENAENEKTLIEDKLEFFASIFSLVMLGLAFIIGVIAPLIHGDWQRGLKTASIVLLLGSPSALILTVPVIFLGGLFCASHSGIRFRSKQIVEKLFRVKTAVFSKTGTITDAHFRISDVVTDKVSAEKLLQIAAAAESYSRHPIAMAIKQAANWTEEQSGSVVNAEEIPGQGVSAIVEGNSVYVGNAALMEAKGIWYRHPSQAGCTVHVAVQNEYLGYILLNDNPREGVFDMIEELRLRGLKEFVMLTGDVQSTTPQRARSLNFTLSKTSLTPEGKISAISYLRKNQGKGESLVCIGDGFHDAGMFESADVGIAMNAMGDDLAENAADVILMDDDIQRIPAVFRIVTGVARLLMTDVGLLSGSRLLLLVLGLSGTISILPAALLNTAFVAAACFVALRSFSIE